MGVRSQSLWMEISKQEGVWGSFLWRIEPFLWGSKFDSPESHQAQPITTAYQHKRLGFPALKIRKIFLVLMSVLYPLLIPLYLCHSFPWPVSALIHAKNRCCQYQQPCVLPRVSRIWGGGAFLLKDLWLAHVCSSSLSFRGLSSSLSSVVPCLTPELSSLLMLFLQVVSHPVSWLCTLYMCCSFVSMYFRLGCRINSRLTHIAANRTLLEVE